MKIIMMSAAAFLALAAATLDASAGTELDKAMGSGSFIHPLGPAGGAGHTDSVVQGKR